LKQIWPGFLHSDAINFSHLIRRHSRHLNASVSEEALFDFRIYSYLLTLTNQNQTEFKKPHAKPQRDRKDNFFADSLRLCGLA
jgi:hypothetical protein